MNDPRLHAFRAIRGKTEVGSDTVGFFEADAGYIVAQAVGCFFDDIDGGGAVCLEDLYRKSGAEVLPAEHHDAAHTELSGEVIMYFIGAFRAYAAYIAKPTGVVFDNIKGVRAEFIDNPVRRDGADPFYGAGGEITPYCSGIFGELFLEIGDFELTAEGRVHLPITLHAYRFALAQKRHYPDKRHRLASAVYHADGIAVFIV